MKYRKYTKEWLEELCAESSSYRELLEKAGRSPHGGGNYNHLKLKIKEFNIDTSHFKGQGWSKGLTKETDDRIVSQEKYNIDEIFIEDSSISRKIIRQYILRHKLIPYKCERCSNDGFWMDQVMALELDHINGKNNDHRLVNLRFYVQIVTQLPILIAVKITKFKPL